MARKKLTILGSTGSIGRQVLDVARAHPEHVEIIGLGAGTNLSLLLEQTAEFKPAWVHIAAPDLQRELAHSIPGGTARVVSGDDGLRRMATEPDASMVVVATVGWTGVEPTLAAIEAGRDIALANKEVLVCAGELVMSAAADAGVRIWPLDSEHNAIMQCLAAGPRGPLAPIRRIILTCSGGPFRAASPGRIESAMAAETLDHPTWEMGRKITVDSATLMNKGFEVIEAHHLFGVPLEQIEVVIHPQSLIHSMVEFVDGSMIAQLGVTDMRLPIQNVLTWPERRPTILAPLDLTAIGSLEFERPDTARFPCLQMAYDAATAGGTRPCVLNAANEVAVAAHLAGRISCGAIPRIIRRVLDHHVNRQHPFLEDLREADRWGRQEAEAALAHEGASRPSAGVAAS